MTEHSGAANAQLREGLVNQVRLGRVRPKGSARTLAIAEAGSVKNDDPIFFRSLVDEAARRKVLNHACIAVQQHQRLALAVVEIVKTKTTNFQELPDWRVITLRLFCSKPV